jgi:hypothetical protein
LLKWPTAPFKSREQTGRHKPVELASPAVPGSDPIFSAFNRPVVIEDTPINETAKFYRVLVLEP